MTITESTGTHCTVAQKGGRDHLDIEYSAHQCQVGIYISPKCGPASLDHTVVNGAFGIGIYVDSVGTMFRRTVREKSCGRSNLRPQ